MMLKTTTRYKLNKIISETPADNINFALDVNSTNLNQAFSEMKKVSGTDSFTLIVIPNKSPRGIL